MNLKRAITALLGLLLVSAAIAQGDEIAQKGNLRVSFSGKISPHKLPRDRTAPVSVSLAGDITTLDGSTPPQLQTITMAINRHGIIDGEGIPICHVGQIQPASTQEAREACSRSIVGTGQFKANVALPEQSPFPSNGKVLAFYGTLKGAPAIFAHIYGTEPLPTSFTLPFTITHKRSGTFSAVLSAKLPRVAAAWGYVSGVSLNLSRTYSYRGEKRSFISAGCPAPKGFPGTSFTFAKASYGFEGGQTLGSKMTRSCGVRG